MSEAEHYFYGKPISRVEQQETIEAILLKYKSETPNEALKEKIYDELMREKYEGRVTIPFRVILRKDHRRQYPTTIEVILDSKVWQIPLWEILMLD